MGRHLRRKEANISVSSNTDGAKQDYEFRLDNQDLETMLNIPSVDMPLHERLQKDFHDSAFRYEPVIYQIELPRKDSAHDVPIEKLVKSAKADSYLSSPLPNEELILPLTIDGKRRKSILLHQRSTIFIGNRTEPTERTRSVRVALILNQGQNQDPREKYIIQYI